MGGENIGSLTENSKFHNHLYFFEGLELNINIKPNN